MKTFLLSIVVLSLSTQVALAEVKKAWQQSAEEYCSDGNGQIIDGRCEFPTMYKKGDEVLRLINEVLEVKLNESYVLEGNAMDCLVQWSSSGQYNWSEERAEAVYGELVFINLNPDRKYKDGPKKGQEMGVGIPLDRFWIARDVTYTTKKVDYGIESENDFYVKTEVKVAGLAAKKYLMTIHNDGDAAFGLSFKNDKDEEVSLEQYCEIEF